MMFLSGNFSGSLNATQKVNQVFGNFISGERSIIGNILNFIRYVGSGLAIIMLTYMAISYFTADGRGAMFINEKKANLKGKQLKQFAIGAFLFIGASNVLYYVSQIFVDVIGVL